MSGPPSLFQALVSTWAVALQPLLSPTLAWARVSLIIFVLLCVLEEFKDKVTGGLTHEQMFSDGNIQHVHLLVIKIASIFEVFTQHRVLS